MNGTRPTAPDADQLWDDWSAARALRPELEPAEFARRYGQDAQHIEEELRLMLAIRARVEPGPLVELAIGDAGFRFAGFRLLDTLGRGSAGVVYLAEPAANAGLPARVALKVLNPLAAGPGEQRASILREAQLAKELAHPGIVAVLASGEERGYTWIATEYVAGETLEHCVMAPRSQLERNELAVSVGVQVAQALAHAHARGIVHRDLKPSNLMRAADGVVRILDFGLARLPGSALTVSRSGELVGTPLYMALEQARGESDVGVTADVYALGLVLIELASGVLLGYEGPPHELLPRIARGRLRPPRRVLARVEPSLRSVLLRCIEPHPADRVPDCAALRAALEDIHAGRRPKWRALSTVERNARRVARHPLRSVVLVAVLAALGYGVQHYLATRPVPVHFEVRADQRGKRVTIDGVERGLEPLELELAPGEHSWQASFGDRFPFFSGTFRVAAREPLHQIEFVTPWLGVPDLEQRGGPGDDERWCYVVVATPHETIQLAIDGVEQAPSPGIVSLRVGVGRSHALVVGAEGRRPRRFEFDVQDQRLRFFPAELDETSSPWTTHILYSNFDEPTRAAVRELRGLRPYFEDMSSSGETRLNVKKSYWGPLASGEPGEVSLRIDLGGALEDVRVELAYGAWVQGTEAWARIECGPDEQQLRELLFMCHGAPPVPAATRKESLADLEFYEVPEARSAALLAVARGARSLVIKYSVGAAVAGREVAYGCAMRTNAFPDRTPRGLLWHPAVRLQVRTR